MLSRLWYSSQKEQKIEIFLQKVVWGIGKKDFDIEGQCINLEFEDFYLVNVYVPNVGRKLVTLPKRLEWNVHFEARRLWRMVFFILLFFESFSFDLSYSFGFFVRLFPSSCFCWKLLFWLFIFEAGGSVSSDRFPLFYIQLNSN